MNNQSGRTKGDGGTPNHKRKAVPNEKLVVPRHEGESDAEYKRRGNKEYKKRCAIKKEAEAESKKRAMQTSQKTSTHEENDFFLKKVAGMNNFVRDDPKTKYNSCKAAVSLRLNITELLVGKEHVESKDVEAQRIVSANEFKVGFHVDPDHDVGDPECSSKVKEVRKLETYPWLHIKKSTIEGAGYGCFADTDFSEGAVLGLYMGGTTGLADYQIVAGFDAGKKIKCYPLTDRMALGERSAKTMGLQMMNDPKYGLKEGEETDKKVNAEIKSDLFVVAMADIKKGEEIFIDYNLADCESSDSGNSEEGYPEKEDNSKSSEGSAADDPDHEEEEDPSI
jgi:hypothetical protein